MGSESAFAGWAAASAASTGGEAAATRRGRGGGGGAGDRSDEAEMRHWWDGELGVLTQGLFGSRPNIATPKLKNLSQWWLAILCG